MSKNQHLAVEDCYARGTSPFRTVIMTAQEARFINEQANLGFIKLEEKPTTIAIQKFRNNRLAVVDSESPAGDEGSVEPEAAVAEPAASATEEPAA